MTANNHRGRPTQPGAPALIEHDTLKFLIVNNPAQATLPQFVKVCFACGYYVCLHSWGEEVRHMYLLG